MCMPISYRRTLSASSAASPAASAAALSCHFFAMASRPSIWSCMSTLVILVAVAKRGRMKPRKPSWNLSILHSPRSGTVSLWPSAQCTPLRNGVQVGGWRFESESGRILSTREINTLTERLEALTVAEALPSAVPPLPAAIFGHSYLTLTHEASGRVIHFDADGAITSWVRESAEKGSGGLKVTTASASYWKQVADEQATGDTTDYDWTYSTDYCGTTSTAHHASDKTPNFIESAFRTKVEYVAWLRTQSTSEAAPESPAEASGWKEHTGSGFDMALLRRCDVPILHYVDLPLYEDELDDADDVVDGVGAVVLRQRLEVGEGVGDGPLEGHIGRARSRQSQKLTAFSFDGESRRLRQ